METLPHRGQVARTDSEEKAEALEFEHAKGTGSPALQSSGDDDDNVVITWRTWGVIILCGYANFVSITQVLGFPFLTGFIIQDFGDAHNSTWIFAGPNLLSAALSPFVARLSDLLHDRRWIIIVCTGISIIGAIISALAPNINILIVGQMMSSFFALENSLLTAIPAEILPRRHRGNAQAFMGIASSLGACAGGLIGAASVTKDPSGWRNFAWLCVALRASMCSFFFFFYRPAKVPRPSYTFAEVMHKCDWIGSLILATGLVLLLFGLIGGGESWSWSSGTIIGTLVTGAAVLVAFGIYEWKARTDGIVDHRLFRFGRNYLLSCWCLFISGFIYFGTLAAIVPQMILNSGIVSNAMGVALQNFYSNIVIFFVTPFMGWHVAKWREPRPSLILSQVGFVAVLVLLALAPSGPDGFKYVISAMFISGITLAAPLILYTMCIQLVCPPELIATACTLSGTGRAIGGATGGILVTAVYQAKMADKLPAAIAAVVAQTGISTDLIGPIIGAIPYAPQAVAQFPGVTPAILGQLRSAYGAAVVASYAPAWYSLIPFTISGAIATCFMYSYRNTMTARVDFGYEDATHHGGEAAFAEDDDKLQAGKA